MNSSVRKLPAALVAGALLLSLTACGQGSDTQDSSSSATASSSTAVTAATQSGDQSVLDKVKVTRNADGAKKPTVKVPSPVADDAAAGAKIINQGDGAELKQGQVLTLNIAAVQGSDGKAVSGDDYTSATTLALTSNSFASDFEDAYAVLLKAKVGADIGVLVPASMTTNVPQVLIMHVKAATDAPKKASAAEVSSLKVAGDLPTVAFNKGVPKITIPKGKSAPHDLIVDVVKEGDGPAATEASQVTVKYLGVTWKAGKKFDSSYDKSDKTATFGLNQVISGWTTGLTGIKQGSTVLLSVPASMAYGDQAQSGSPSGPLVFVVELDKVS